MGTGSSWSGRNRIAVAGGGKLREVRIQHSRRANRAAPNPASVGWRNRRGLVRAGKDRVFRESTAVQVRRALEKVSTMGTAAGALKELAATGRIAAKTGTAGFYRRGKWQGEGGSWCVAVDSVTKAAVAVRVRWASGHPFELEGGRSAALVVRKAIAGMRDLHKEDEQ